MKKVVSMIILVVLATVLSMSTIVLAADTEPTFVLTGQVNKVRGVARTKEVSITFGVKDFANFPAAKNGINALQGVLDFDENVFEPIEINTTEQGYFKEIKTVTKKGEKAMLPQSEWYGLTYNPETKKFVIENGNITNKKQDALKVTLKVKVTAPVGNTTVKLTNVKGSSGDMDVIPSSLSVNIEILEAISEEGIDPDHENGFGGYIRMLPDTTVAEFKALKTTMLEVKVGQQTASESALVLTGATATDGDYSYTLIAVGDLNSDGTLTVTDLGTIKAFETGQKTNMTDDQKRAADIKWDLKLTATDRGQMKNMITGLGDPRINTWYGTGDKTCKPVESTR